MLLDSRQADPDGTGPLPAGAPGTAANQPYNLARTLYWWPNRGSANDTEANELVFGIEGELAADWTWEAYYQNGTTTMETRMTDFVWEDRYRALAAQPNFGRGGSITVASANESTVTRVMPCTSGLPLLEPWVWGPNYEVIYPSGFELSQDCIDAITARHAATATSSSKTSRRPTSKASWPICVPASCAAHSASATASTTACSSRTRSTSRRRRPRAKPRSARSTAKFCTRSSAASSSSSVPALRTSRPATGASTRNRTRRCSTGSHRIRGASAAAGSARTACRTSPSCTRARQPRCSAGAQPATRAWSTRCIHGATSPPIRTAQKLKSCAGN